MKAAAAKTQKLPDKKPGSIADENKRLNLLLPFLVSLITLACFSYSFKADFVHWDDNAYVYENSYITSFSAHNLNRMLFHIITAGNYHPLTMLSLAINYHFSGLSPLGYHLTNILLHLINTVLVFFLFKMLFETMQKRGYGDIPAIPWIAALGALWHGIHPMHVESVSWISERKDLLYALFYFSGLFLYVQFIQTHRNKTFLYVIILFILSVLSKPAAVVFPLTLLTLDFLLRRPFTFKLLIEKTPFFIISLLLGIYTFTLQKKGGAMSAHFDTFTFFQRFLFSCYDFMMYILRAIAPVHLSSFYPYPNRGENNILPIEFLLSPVIDVMLTGIPLYLARRAGPDYFRITVAGILFYFFNVVLILKFVTVGGSLLSDRYTYVAYTGLFLIILYVGVNIYKKYPSAGKFIKLSAVIYSFILVIVCFNRTMVWQNSQTLWEDMKNKYPLRIEDPYVELGKYYRELGATNPVYYDSALNNYEILKNYFHTKEVGNYTNMANIYALKKDYTHSFEAYSLALKYDSADTSAYLNRAVTYINMNHPALAIKDLDKALVLDSTSAVAFQNRAYAFYLTGNFQQSVSDYNHLIKLYPSEPTWYFKKGSTEYSMGNMTAALEDYKKTLTLQPGNAECMYDISIVYHALNNNAAAMTYAINAQQLGYPLPSGYLNALKN